MLQLETIQITRKKYEKKEPDDDRNLDLNQHTNLDLNQHTNPDLNQHTFLEESINA
jgi:hypothetical protein